MIKIHSKTTRQNFTKIYDVTETGLSDRMVGQNPEPTVARWVDMIRQFWNGNLEA